MGKLRNKLIEIQNELKAPKGQFNSFGKYYYRNAEDILEAAKPLLKKHEVALVLYDNLINIGDRYYIKATARLFDDEETMEVYAFAREEESKKGMDGSQVTGASSSYARKYALNGLFCIDDNKDSDTTNKHDQDKKSAKRPNTRSSMKSTQYQKTTPTDSKDDKSVEELIKKENGDVWKRMVGRVMSYFSSSDLAKKEILEYSKNVVNNYFRKDLKITNMSKLELVDKGEKRDQPLIKGNTVVQYDDVIEDIESNAADEAMFIEEQDEE